MRRDCDLFVKNCTACTVERQWFTRQTPLTPCPQPSKACEGWSMDLITDLPPSAEGHTFVMVIVDCFTKWVELYPLRSKSAAEIASVLYREFLPRFGRPAWIRVDAGREWLAETTQLADYIGTVIRTAASGYPRTNG